MKQTQLIFVLLIAFIGVTKSGLGKELIMGVGNFQPFFDGEYIRFILERL